MTRRLPVQLSAEQARRLWDAPVGRLATTGKSGDPHVIPVCFVLEQSADGAAVYVVLDQKPKRTPLTSLRRVRNILENPRAALVVDHYETDWTKLWYILLSGRAELITETDPPTSTEGLPAREPALPDAAGRKRAIQLLRQKYPQYRDMDIDENPVIRITVRRVVAWSHTPETAAR